VKVTNRPQLYFLPRAASFDRFSVTAQPASLSRSRPTDESIPQRQKHCNLLRVACCVLRVLRAFARLANLSIVKGESVDHQDGLEVSNCAQCCSLVARSVKWLLEIRRTVRLQWSEMSVSLTSREAAALLASLPDMQAIAIATPAQNFDIFAP
jgi:hypothetical protein